jgi:hypothetical protein
MESLPARSAIVRASFRMRGISENSLGKRRAFSRGTGPGAHVQLLHRRSQQALAHP